MREDEQIPLFPLVTFTATALPDYGVIVFRPDYLSRMGQKPEEATRGQSFALSPELVRNLIAELQKSLDLLESPLYKKPSVPNL
ncbi:hypothetical protein LG200_01985 [Methylobacillus caricis]|uniref:hypothetical protein n=1 Tax=Methylobacillus caricis TaxID=1971611 RepID=UPI001CFF919A|nr:hypothetical protein [Methylobacillus caricis]MCB5186771.1 hypothetical protein [Methylobacillus caricis]